MHKKMAEAGYSMVPNWASGAIFLVPLTHDMNVEADVGNLRPQHVVALETDVERITRARTFLSKMMQSRMGCRW